MKDIPGYEGRYAVTLCGRVYSYPNRAHKNGTFLSSTVGTHGYSVVCLTVDKQPKPQLVHRLVASAWLMKKSEEQTCVNHKNSNRQDNRATNLEYCTYLENIQHAMMAHNGVWGRPAKEAK